MVNIDLNEFENKDIILVISPEASVTQTFLKITEYFVNVKDSYCIYVTLNKPYSSLLNLLRENKIKTEKMFFIDAVTRLSGTGMQRAGNCVFCQTPTSLTAISIALSGAMETIPKDKPKILFLDSLSTLLIYNQSGTVAKFAHFLTTKMRFYEIKGIVLSVEDGNKEMIQQISQFCDAVVRVKEEEIKK